MNKLSLVVGGVCIGAGIVMMTQERRIEKIHKMYENLISEMAADTYTRAWTDGSTFGVQQYRHQVVRDAVFN